MPAVQADPAGHLSLVHDLLSPPSTQLASSTPTAIAVQLATLSIDTDTLTSFVHILLTSQSLWKGVDSPPPLSRSQDIFSAIHKGILLRVDNIKEDYEYGWRARRHLGHVLDAMLSGLDESIPPIFRLLFCSGVLAALQSIKLRHDELYVGGSNLMGRMEGLTLSCWEQLLAQPDAVASADRFVLPCWLATRSLNGLESAQLAHLPSNAFLDLLLNALSDCFADGRLFDHMQEDCESLDEGLEWRNPSPSRTLLTQLHERPLFAELGRLSQIIGKAIESVDSADALHVVFEHLQRLERLAERVNKGWLATKWSELADESDLAPALRQDKAAQLPWTLLKTLLFSLTMVHSSLISLLASAPADEPAELTLELCACSIRTFGFVYFVTSRFGSDGFGAYRGVWYGALDLSNRAADPSRIEALARNIEPKQAKGEMHAVTYYLNVIEQVIENLPDAYLEQTALPIARRYLDRAHHADAFEAAHSVVLAVYAKGKRCSEALAPWYTSLLLRLFPDYLSTPQLRLAYTAVVRQCSETSDALAWLCVQKVLAAIEAVSADDKASAASGGQPDLSSLGKPADAGSDVKRAEGRPQDEEEHADSSPLTEARLSALEARALALPRGALLLVLIDLLGALNLTLLLPALEAIERFLTVEPAGEAKKALVRCLLVQLANQDAAKRVGAVRWWQEHSSMLWSGATGKYVVTSDASEVDDARDGQDFGERIGQRDASAALGGSSSA